jgi:hypothetical protein
MRPLTASWGSFSIDLPLTKGGEGIAAALGVEPGGAVMNSADRAAAALGRLHELGAINLDVLLERADEVRGAISEFGFDGEPDICYPFMVHIGPPHFGDVVQVASQLKQLGFTVSRG